MRIYKVTFLKNEILSCREVEASAIFDGNSYFEYDKGQMIFAIIKAKTEVDAHKAAKAIAEKVLKDNLRNN